MARSSILVVDSDGELLKIISSFLNSQGYRTNQTGRVREAVAKLALQKYALVLLEPNLSGDRGEEVMRAASDPHGLNARTPFVLLTKTVKYELPNDVLAQIKGIVLKPFQFEDLLSAISAAISVPQG